MVANCPHITPPKSTLGVMKKSPPSVLLRPYTRRSRPPMVRTILSYFHTSILIMKKQRNKRSGIRYYHSLVNEMHQRGLSGATIQFALSKLCQPARVRTISAINRYTHKHCQHDNADHFVADQSFDSIINDAIRIMSAQRDTRNAKWNTRRSKIYKHNDVVQTMHREGTSIKDIQDELGSACTPPVSVSTSAIRAYLEKIYIPLDSDFFDYE